MRVLALALILLPCLVVGQLNVVLDSIDNDKLYRYPLGDFTQSPHYKDLSTYSDADLSEIESESLFQHLYINDILLRRSYDHDMLLPWPESWQEWLSTYISNGVSLIKQDIVVESNALAAASAATLLQDGDLDAVINQLQHPQIRAFIGRALVRRRDYDALDRVLPLWIGDLSVLWQQEGCNHYDRLVGDYILRGAAQPGHYQQLLDRYQALLLSADNRLDATAAILMRGPAPDSLLALYHGYLTTDGLPIAAAAGIVMRRDSLSTLAFSKVVDCITSRRLDPRQIGRVESFFKIAGPDLLAVAATEDIKRLDQYIRDHKEKVRLSIGWPFYRWLNSGKQYEGLVHRATRTRIIPEEQLLVEPPQTYKVKFK